MKKLQRALVPFSLVLGFAALAACISAGPPPPFVVELAEPMALGPDDVVVPPVAVERPAPQYPVELRRARAEGEVVVKGVVGRDGRMRDFQVVQAAHPGFADAFLAVLPRWRFQPATLNGEPVAVHYQVETFFRLQ